jgi:hypothetical protein
MEKNKLHVGTKAFFVRSGLNRFLARSARFTLRKILWRQLQTS